MLAKIPTPVMLGIGILLLAALGYFLWLDKQPQAPVAATKPAPVAVKK